MIGSTVDQFKIAKMLAKSPVGDKYLAVHSQTGAKFILQSVSPQLVRQAGFRKNFLEDASRLIKFEHPNVVPLVNVLEENGQLYLVQEFFEGLSLSEMAVSQAGRLSLEGVLRLFKDILRGVGYAHAEGAIHKFLNPKNIIVTEDGEAKITGFGNVLSEAEEHLMAAEERAYAARYFSPERIRNPNTTDIRANIYALGAILYQLVSGKPPYSGDSFEAQAKQHMEAQVPDPGEINPSLTPTLVNAIKTALAKRPEDRFQNTIEFYQALEKGQAELAAKSQGGDGLKFGVDSDATAEPGFNFDLPGEIQEHDFKFDLGSEVPTGTSVSDMMDLTGGDGLPDVPEAIDNDPFASHNLESGGTSLDFSGFGNNEGGNGLFDLNLQAGNSDEGGLDFGSQSDQDNIDLDRLSFGSKGSKSGDAFDLGSRDAADASLGSFGTDETVQERRHSGSGAKDSLDFNLGAEGGGLDFGISNQDQNPSDDLNIDGFDLGSEFPSEGGDDPFSNVDDSSDDVDLSFKGHELSLDEKPASSDFSLEDSGSQAEDHFSAGSDDLNFSDPALQLDGGDDADTFADSDPFTTDQDQTQPDANWQDNATGSGMDADDAMGMPAGEPHQGEDFGAPGAHGAEMHSDPDLMHRTGLEDSLAKIEAVDAEVQAEKARGRMKVKKVRKLDKKLLGLTAALAAIVVLALFFWLNQQKKQRDQERTISDIQQLVDQRQYSEALDRISDFMGRSPSGRFSDLLADIQRQIRSEQRQIASQVENLLDRASNFELEGKLLEDGTNDAYGTYHTILSLDPSQDQAKQAGERIRKMQLEKADALIENERPVEALAIYAALTKANRGDRDTDKKYKALKNRLKETKSDALIAEIENLYNERDYTAISVPFAELDQIDPKSDFVRKMRRTLVGELVSKSKEALALRNYEDSENYLRMAVKFDPDNKQVNELLSDMGEERLRGDIESSVKALEQAITNKDFARQYQLSNQILTMDPGNRTAISSLDAVKAHVANLGVKGEEMRELGNFKGAASVYRQIYLINKNEQARVLWSKFDNWTPPEGMAYVPAGNFKQGDNSTRDARPAHEVFISSFYMDKYEVTNREFKAFVDANPKWRPDRISASLHDGNYLKHWRNGQPLNDDLDRPVTYVSWFAASAYAAWQNKRLPTEAEWEKAAAGNTQGKKYWWGNYSDAKMAVYEFYKEKLPAPVGSFPANGFGVHEILGNVHEWNEDSYDPRFYRSAVDARNPKNTDPTLPEKVYRGGSYRSRGGDLMLYLRYHGDPKLCHTTLGFRCVMDAKTF